MLANATRAMPLLGRELVELAARRRTYVLRVLYATGLFLIVGLVLQNQLRTSGGEFFQLQGKGSDIFNWIIGVQLAGIYLFLPAMMSGAIAQEKERDSLELLLLTDIGPWGIVVQKYLGRLIPMITFLLLSLPVMGVAFTFGGIEMQQLTIWIWALLLTILHVGAVALAASAFCRSTAAAFIMSYIALALVYAAPFIVLGVYAVVSNALDVAELRPRHLDDIVAILIPARMIESLPDVYRSASRSLPLAAGPARTLAAMAIAVLVTSAAGLVISAAGLVLSRIWLVTRAHVPPSSMVMTTFRAIDTVMNRSNKLVGGVVLIPDRETLPADRPVAWLETAKRPTGKARYLIRLLVLTMIPVLFVSTAVVIYRRGGSQSEPLSVVLMLTWAVTMLLLLMQSASAVSSERRRQTLDVLLATPIEGSQILKEKMAPIWRMIAVLLVPFMTVVVTEAWWEYGLEERLARSWRNVTPTTLYVTCSILSLLIYLPMTAYLGMLMGLLIRSQVRAIMVSLVVMLTWLFGPLLLYAIIAAFLDQEVDALLLATPGTIVLINEMSLWSSFLRSISEDLVNVGREAWWALMLFNFAFYGMIALALRFVCHLKADKLLGRV